MEDSQIVQLYWTGTNRPSAYSGKVWELLPLGCREYPREQQGCRRMRQRYLPECLERHPLPPHRPQVLSASSLGKLPGIWHLIRHKRNTADKRGGGEAAAVLEELAEVVSGRDNVEQEVDRRALVNEIDVFLGKLPRKSGNFPVPVLVF